jgi:Cu/Ag efflux protein CusF
MKKLYALVCMLLLGSSLAWAIPAGTTTVNVTGLVDPDGFTWKNGTYSIDFVYSPNVTSPNAFVWSGGALVMHYAGNLNGSGAFTINLPYNSSIKPAGSKWRFNFCARATSGCFSYTTTITSTSPNDITAAVNAVAKAPRFVQGMYNYGYGPVEVSSTITTGAFFYDVTVGACKQYSGSGWGLCPSNAATYDATNVAITGGTINGTAIGGTTPAAGTFTTVHGTLYGSALVNFNADSTNTGVCTTAATIKAINGNAQKVTLTHGDICALTFTQPVSGTILINLEVIQSSVSAFDGSISGCKWPGGTLPTITTTTGAVDIIKVFLDGTNAYCVADQNFKTPGA